MLHKISYLNNKSLIDTLMGNAGFIRALAFTPDGNTLISLGTKERFRLWKAAPVEK